MNSRQRVKAAIDFKSPDKVPVEYYYCPVGYYEHGEKLNELYMAHPGDFSPFVKKEIPVLGPECFDSDGRYYEKKKDAWGTTWEYRIFGITGIECEYPILNYEDFDTYKLPKNPDFATDENAFKVFSESVKNHQKEYYMNMGAGGFFEKLIALRPFEDVLCDLLTDDEKIIELMDKIESYYATNIDAMIRAGVDQISFGDDYGTETNLIFSKEIFRTHFKPRYKRLIEPIKKAGINVHFHSCGKVDSLFEDFKEMGVDSVWPQIPAYDMQYLADKLKDLQLAIAIHTDRANTMTFGTPDDVCELVKKEYDIFRPDKGGSWFYVEADNGMPFENIKTLVETIYKYR